MAWFLFPNEMNSCKASSYNGLILRIFRICAMIITGLMLFTYSLHDGMTYFVYLTSEGITLTFSFFVLSNCAYFFSVFDKPACILFQIIWALNWCITLAFWCYLYPRETFSVDFRDTICHTIPLGLTLIDFVLNQIAFIRIQFLFPMVYLVCYFFFVLMPYTLEEGAIYSGVTFENMRTYLILAGILIVVYGSLELAKLYRSWYRNHCSLEKSLI